MIAIVTSSLIKFTGAQSPPAKPKILCLHGGGQNANSFKNHMSAIENALPEFEFVYANGAYSCGGNNCRL